MIFGEISLLLKGVVHFLIKTFADNLLWTVQGPNESFSATSKGFK